VTAPAAIFSTREPVGNSLSRDRAESVSELRGLLQDALDAQPPESCMGLMLCPRLWRSFSGRPSTTVRIRDSAALWNLK
jgi:hypothetical protein